MVIVVVRKWKIVGVVTIRWSFGRGIEHWQEYLYVYAVELAVK
jgi:hypothetical protein